MVYGLLLNLQFHRAFYRWPCSAVTAPALLHLLYAVQSLRSHALHALSTRNAHALKALQAKDSKHAIKPIPFICDCLIQHKFEQLQAFCTSTTGFLAPPAVEVTNLDTQRIFLTPNPSTRS